MAVMDYPVLLFYGVAVVWWLVLAALHSRRNDPWDFVPPWHRWGVPLFRSLFLVSLPVEYISGEHAFDPTVFTIATVATVSWLLLRSAWHWHYRCPQPPAESVAYNLLVVANLMAFAVAMHSFVCLAIMVNISLPALWLRYRYLRRLTDARTHSLAARRESMKDDNASQEQTAILGGGCFWCIEGVFQYVDGVREVLSGYAGGDTPNPDYESVCTGRTGHAEVVRIRYDPSRVGFKHLLDVFFTIHDPTQLNRQGPDRGTQYRSVIFCLDDAQHSAAEGKIAELEGSGAYNDPIVTEIAGPATFYPAEDYHQRFFEANAGTPYCEYMIRPKLAKIQERFGSATGA